VISKESRCDDKSCSSFSDKTCHKCLTPGHFIYDCPNDWVCRKCHESGHKMMDCSKDFNEENSDQNKHI
jgi:hypothetical protein